MKIREQPKSHSKSLIAREFQEFEKVPDRLGEWLLVGSVAAAGLPAWPGAIACFTMIVFFFVRPQNRPGWFLRRRNKLKEMPNRSAAEEAEYQHLEEGVKYLNPNDRMIGFKIGFSFWVLVVFVYEIVYKGVYRHQMW